MTVHFLAKDASAAMPLLPAELSPSSLHTELPASHQFVLSLIAGFAAHTIAYFSVAFEPLLPV